MDTNFIVKFLYEDLLMPDDTFRIRAQKRLIAFTTPIGILPLAWALFSLTFIADTTPNEILNLVVRIVFFTSILLLWATTRYRRAYTDAMGNAFFLALNICHLATILTDPNHGSEGACVALVVGAIAFGVDAIRF